MGQRFDPTHWQHFEDPQRLKHLPPSIVVSLLQLRGDETVIDFGAGTGAYSLPVAEALPDGRMIAVDDSAGMLSHLCEKLERPEWAAVRERVQVVHSRHDAVPLPDACAQRLLAINVLHHIHDEATPRREIVRLLAERGLLVVIEPGDIKRPIGPSREHVLSHERLRAVIAAMGLEEVACHEPGGLLPWHIVVIARKVTSAQA